MPTLLLKLIAPMQSWGVQSNFTHRDTGFEPSKSGVIGLICAALGRDRSEKIDDLAALTMGVRVDRQGTVLKDYHTAKDVMRAGGGRPKDTELSDRFYLADAAFLVGLEGNERDRVLLEEIQHHLKHPVWMLFLGRKAFPPSEPIWISNAQDETKPNGIRELSLRDALVKGHPRLRLSSSDNPETRLVLEDKAGDIARPDQPISFKKGARQFTVRRVKIDFVTLETNPEEV
jgi:CRISPR system Cascade subunit CasD